MKTNMHNHTNCLQILEHTIRNMTKLQSNMQGDSTSNEQIFGKITSQEKHKDSGIFFFLLLSMYFQFCTCKLNVLINSTKNGQQISKTTN